MRSAVGSEEELRITAGGGFKQGLPMALAFEYWQAIVVGSDAALENGVAVIEQVMCGDRGRNRGRSFAHILHCILGGEMF